MNLSDFSNTENAQKVERFVQEISTVESREIFYEGIELGRKALYEVIIKYKKRDMNLNELQNAEWISNVRNQALLIGPAQKIISEIKPDAVMVYNAQYGTPGTFADVSIKMGIQTFTISGSSAPVEAATALKIWDWGKYRGEDPAIFNWSRSARLSKVSRRNQIRLSRHLNYIETGNSPWTYSQGKSNVNPYEFYGIKKSDKIVLAVLNSEDEKFAAEIGKIFPISRTRSKVFETQIDWVNFLIQLYGNIDGVTLIIRLHPREFPNKREQQLSEQAKIWETTLNGLPNNVLLDHPDKKFSIYDYYPFVGVLTTGWSSTAIEALLKGIPVVTYDKNILGFPSDLVMSGTSQKEYEENLLRAHLLSRDRERITAAADWLIYSLFEGSVFLGGGLQDAHLRVTNKILRFMIRAFNRLANIVCPSQIKKIDLGIPTSKRDARKITELLLQRKTNLHE